MSGSRPCQPAGVHQVALEGMRGHAQPRVSRSRSNLEQVRRHRSGVVSLTQAAPSSLARRPVPMRSIRRAENRRCRPSWPDERPRAGLEPPRLQPPGAPLRPRHTQHPARLPLPGHRASRAAAPAADPTDFRIRPRPVRTTAPSRPSTACRLCVALRSPYYEDSIVDN